MFRAQVVEDSALRISMLHKLEDSKKKTLNPKPSNPRAFKVRVYPKSPKP